MSAFDLGDWYSSSMDPQRLRINKFKEGFGTELLKTLTAFSA